MQESLHIDLTYNREDTTELDHPLEQDDVDAPDGHSEPTRETRETNAEADILGWLDCGYLS
jgi:hypothetical protein